MVNSEYLLDLARSGSPLSVQRAALEAGLAEQGLSPGAVAAVMSQTLDGFIVLETNVPTGSRIGGGDLVRLPSGVDWPKDGDCPLAFLFEIDLDELVGSAGVVGAPTGGSLLLFHDEDPGIEDSWLASTRVLFRSADDPGVETTEGRSYDWQPIGRRYLQGFASPIIGQGPELDDARQQVGATWEETSSAIDALTAHVMRAHRFLGAPTMRQAAFGEEVAIWFSELESDDDRDRFSEAEQRGEGWCLLLQPVDPSDPGPDIDLQWSVAGSRYHVIPEVDLHAGKFDRVITLSQG